MAEKLLHSGDRPKKSMPMNSGSESKNPVRAIGICKRSLTSADASIKQDMVFWPSKAKALCKAKRKLTGGWMVNISWITFTEPVQQAVRKRVAPGGDQMNGLALAWKKKWIAAALSLIAADQCSGVAPAAHRALIFARAERSTSTTSLL